MALTAFFKAILKFGTTNKIFVNCFCTQVSFDVVSLFTSVPLKTAKTIVTNRVGDDCTLGERTSLTVPELIVALDICLQSSFFVYNNVI